MCCEERLASRHDDGYRGVFHAQFSRPSFA
jgi:hypothetical protein